MAKKSFKQSPALQFISSADEDTHDTQNTDNTEQAHNTHDTQNADNTKQEDIADNVYTKHYTDNTGYTDTKHNTEYADNAYNKQERKTRRLNLLLQPSILDNLSKIAHMKQTSVNDLMNSVLKDYAETEEETISMYDKVFSKKI